MSTLIVGVDVIRDGRYLLRMSPEQCRAARAWLQLSQDDLASAASVSNSTVRDYEAGRRKPIAATLSAMRAVLETQGIVFLDGEAKGLTFRQKAS